MYLKIFILPLLFPVALLGGLFAVLRFVLQAGYHTVDQWLDDQLEEM